MRLKLWSNRALLVCLLGCGGTETPPEETSRTPRRDAGANSDDDDSSDEANSDDEEDDDGTTTTRDAGRRDTGTRIPDGAPEGCGTSEFNTNPVIPDMLIVLDRSGSMRTGGVDRWGPSVAAVKTLTTTFTDQIGFGLMTFPFANELCGPGQIQVPVAMKTAAQIAQILDRSAPQGGTPTGDTLHVALQSYRDTGADAESGQRPRYVLLMTDGQPTCPAAQGTSGSIDSAGNLAADKKLTIDALDQLAAEGIKTFVVGYDAELDPTLAAALNEFAKHGKTERYFPVQDERSLIAAFEDISSTVISCTFAFEKAVSDPRYLRVEFDGKLLRLDDPNGFTFEGQSVTLQGTTCAALQGRASHNVEINLECTPVI